MNPKNLLSCVLIFLQFMMGGIVFADLKNEREAPIDKGISRFQATQSAPVEAINLGQTIWEGEYLGRWMSWYREPRGQKPLLEPPSSGEFVAGQSEVISQGYRSEGFWYRFTLLNPSREAQTVFLFDPNNVYREFDVFVNGQKVQALTQRQVLYDRIVSLTVPPEQESVVHIRKRTIGVAHQAGWTLWKDEAKLHRAIVQVQLQYAVLHTIFVMSILFALALLFAYRHVMYLYYIGYVISFAVFSTWVWSISYIPSFTEAGAALSHFCIFFTVRFVKRFLDIEVHYPKTGLVLEFLGILSLLVIPLEFWDASVRSLAGTVISVCVQFLTVVVGINLFVRRRETYILLFLIAYTSFLGVGFIQMLIWAGIIDSAQNTLMFYGVGLENVLMLLAMSYQMGLSESHRKSNKFLLEHVFKQLAKVLYPHQLLQIQEGKTIEETMPVGDGEACVLFFHIGGLFDVDHETSRKYMNEIMGVCRQELFAGYDARQRKSAGYLVREQMDGFICSVGFPFQQLGESKSLSALQLAERLVRRFFAVTRTFDCASRFMCSITLGRGVVTSYFSNSGRVRDDLWGGVIERVLSMHGRCQEAYGLRDVTEARIVLDETIYVSLPSSMRSMFKLDLDLEPGVDIAVRTYGTETDWVHGEKDDDWSVSFKVKQLVS